MMKWSTRLTAVPLVPHPACQPPSPVRKREKANTMSPLPRFVRERVPVRAGEGPHVEICD